MRNLTHKWPEPGHFFQNSENFFPVFQKGQGKPLRPPCSFGPLLIRKCRIPLLNKFPIMKLKTGDFPLSCSLLEVVSCFFRIAPFIYSIIIKRNCKTAFSSKFRTINWKSMSVVLFWCIFQPFSSFFHLVPYL